MQQLLHILVLDRDRRFVLTTRVGRRWLLPVAACPGGTRLGAAISRVLAGLGVPGDPLGQWDARLTADGRSLDSLAVVSARGTVDRETSGRAWRAIDDLVASTAVLEYQAWALHRRFADHPSSEIGPFETLTWFDEARRWIRDVVGRSVDRLTVHRATGWEIVLGASAEERRWYFKGLTAERALEARVTAALAASCPDSFARTLAIESGSRGTVRWLMVGCRGTSLSERLAFDTLARATTTSVRIQERIGDASSLPDVPPRLDLADLNQWSQHIIDRSRYSCAVDAIDRATGDVAAAGMPDRWIPLDLDPANVLVDDAHVTFIDLDDSYIGPAPLAIATFARRIRSRQTRADAASGADIVRAAYERTSRYRLTPRIWTAFDTLAVLVEAHLAWQRLVTARRRGELHGPVDLVLDRIRTRLAAAVAVSDQSRSRR